MYPVITTNIHWIFLLFWVMRSRSVVGDETLQKENMTEARLKCDSKNGLIGLESYHKLAGIMEASGFPDVWIGGNFTHFIGNWTFLNNSSLEDPKSYFDTKNTPIGCGTVHIGDGYFEYKNCLESGYYALCQKCSNHKRRTTHFEKYFHSNGPTRNWFHARKFCIIRGGDLRIIKTKKDIPEISDHLHQSFWTGVHSLRQEVLLQGDLLANISLEGEDDVQDLIKGDACLTAKNEIPLKWIVVPCSEKHHFKCNDETRSTSSNSTGDETRSTSASSTNTLTIIEISYLAMLLQLLG